LKETRARLSDALISLDWPREAKFRRLVASKETSMAWIRLSAPDRRRDLQSAVARMLGPFIDRATRLHARVLVRRHGASAPQQAFERARIFAAMGDYWGREMWTRVGNAADLQVRNKEH
jgi:hypothetical protein